MFWFNRLYKAGVGSSGRAAIAFPLDDRESVADTLKPAFGRMGCSR